jgi:hypothetical protein
MRRGVDSCPNICRESQNKYLNQIINQVTSPTKLIFWNTGILLSTMNQHISTLTTSTSGYVQKHNDVTIAKLLIKI